MFSVAYIWYKGDKHTSQEIKGSKVNRFFADVEVAATSSQTK